MDKLDAMLIAIAVIVASATIYGIWTTKQFKPIMILGIYVPLMIGYLFWDSRF